MTHYTTNSLFSICSKAPQVDGSFGMTAAIAEMLLQSHEEAIELLPALPEAWPHGRGARPQARGGFEVDIRWEHGALTDAAIRSPMGGRCRLRTAVPVWITSSRAARFTRPETTVIEVDMEPGATYTFKRLLKNAA